MPEHWRGPSERTLVYLRTWLLVRSHETASEAKGGSDLKTVFEIKPLSARRQDDVVTANS